MITGIQNIELSKIIKRLELIKSLISLEEENEIFAHLAKLEQHILTTELEGITIALKEKLYGKAFDAIEAFLNGHHRVAIYIDTQIDALKLELKSLEAEINDLSAEKTDLEKLIYEFGIRHNKELGELILKILNYRKKKAKGTPREAEAEKDYSDYNRDYEASRDEKIIGLTEEELKEIKKIYKKAGKLCHPDVVSEEQKELADKLFTELNVAYEKNDLQRVKEILENLEKGNFFVSKSAAITEKQTMKNEIEKLRFRIKDLKAQLRIIKDGETYKTISNITDWDIFFKETKEKLTEQLK